MNCFAVAYHAMKIADAGLSVISYDRCGFGRSDQRFGNDEYDCISDDLSDVMKATKAEDASLSVSRWAVARSFVVCGDMRDAASDNAV